MLNSAIDEGYHARMHYSDAEHIIESLRSKNNPVVSFVSPVVSVMAATSKIHCEPIENLVFGTQAKGYAVSNGLMSVIENNYSFPLRRGRQGVTYSKLTQLANHNEVDACNAIVNDLIHSQLSKFGSTIVNELCKIVGELHDNVASHANGAGYSAAQVYGDGATKRFEFAIADAGCGMLQNVQSINSDFTESSKAISWCLQRGNTTALPLDGMAQRLPEDALSNPYPPDVKLKQSEDHHAGEGCGNFRK